MMKMTRTKRTMNERFCGPNICYVVVRGSDSSTSLSLT
jgi:hypothetical protein